MSAVFLIWILFGPGFRHDSEIVTVNLFMRLHFQKFER